MSCDYSTAFDETCAQFASVWDATGYEAVYPNLGQDAPDAAASPVAAQPFAKLVFRHRPGDQALGNRLFTRRFTLRVEIRVPSGVSAKVGYDLAKVVSLGFEGQDTASGVWFRNGRIQEVGQDGAWWLTFFLIDGEYTELRS